MATETTYDFDPKTSKNIIVCCDGTWNSPTERDENQVAVTNVYKMYEAVDTTTTLPTPPQLSWYDPGVGAELGTIGKLLSLVGSFAASRTSLPFLRKLGPIVEGATGLGVSQNIRQAYEWLSKVYVPGDRIFLFGFSRGAFQIRSLAGLIYTVGLLRPAYSRYAPVAFKKYKSLRDVDRGPAALENDEADVQAPLDEAETAYFHDRSRLRIHFMGIWDTVAALGLPMWGWSFELFRISTSFHRTTLVPIAENVYHAVAMDEHRSSFMPVLLKAPKGYRGNFEQRWFRGAHADIGGGYARSGLSDITLEWIMKKSELAGLRLRPHALPALKPDFMTLMHDEVAANPAYTFAGVWPRMFPIPPYVTDDTAERIGAWDDSVVRRERAIQTDEQNDPFYWLRRIAREENKKDPALWDRPCHDPRDTAWREVDGSGVRATIYADRIWSPTGAIVRANCRYRVRVAKSDGAPDANKWIDLDDATDANGVSACETICRVFRKRKGLRKLAAVASPRFWFAWGKRHPTARWMQLIGMVNEPTDWKRKTLPVWHLLWYLIVREPKKLLERQYRLGTNVVFEPRHSGPLYCFANDMWLFYGNNSGAIEIEISRVDDLDVPDHAKSDAFCMWLSIILSLILVLALLSPLYLLAKWIVCAAQ